MRLIRQEKSNIAGFQKSGASSFIAAEAECSDAEEEKKGFGVFSKPAQDAAAASARRKARVVHDSASEDDREHSSEEDTREMSNDEGDVHDEDMKEAERGSKSERGRDKREG